VRRTAEERAAWAEQRVVEKQAAKERQDGTTEKLLHFPRDCKKGKLEEEAQLRGLTLPSDAIKEEVYFIVITLTRTLQRDEGA